MTPEEWKIITDLRDRAMTRQDERREKGQSIDAAFWNGARQMAERIELELLGLEK